MKKIFFTITFFLILVFILEANTEKISNLFTRYLVEVHKIDNPPKDQTYIVIDLNGCPPCIPIYYSEIEKLYNDKERKSYPTLIVVGDIKNPPDWFTEFAKNHNNKNIYYDKSGFYRRINVTPAESGIVVVKNGIITSKTILRMENYKEVFTKEFFTKE
jgi:hypothetical protein